MAAKLGANEQVQSIIETELSRDDTKVSDVVNTVDLYRMDTLL